MQKIIITLLLFVLCFLEASAFATPQSPHIHLRRRTRSRASGSSLVRPHSRPTAICNDATYTYNRNPGAGCSRHKGVRTWLQY